MNSLKRAVEKRWYGRLGWLWLLWPLEPIFRLVAWLRRAYLEKQALPLPAPVVIVGNITVGGTGKTPLLIALCKLLLKSGLKPGVVSRGYAAQAVDTPIHVSGDVGCERVGDEPKLIAEATACPVVVCGDRVAAARALLEEHSCDLILSDDGLQHYRLPRQLEIAVVDAERGFGNGHCLPCGPLREPLSRLREVDWVVRNGSHPNSALTPFSPVPMHLKGQAWVNVKTGQRLPLDDRHWLTEPADAVAGIGNPKRFFDTLTELGLAVYPHAFDDHHAYSTEDFAGMEEGTVIMTAKDAVKCHGFARDNWWYLDVSAELPESFRDSFNRCVQTLLKGAPQDTYRD